MDKNKTAVEVFNKSARQYQDKFMDVGLYHDSLDLFCDLIARKNRDILELACGPGNITKYLLDKRPDFKILGTDLAPNMISLAKTNNPGAEFRLMDCRDIGKIEKTFNGVMCSFCLPYLSKEEAIQLIADASSLLNTNGVFYISTLEDDYNKSGIQRSSSGDELFVHFHEEDYLAATLRENGFVIEQLKYQDYPTGNETRMTDLVIIARKEIKSA